MSRKSLSEIDLTSMISKEDAKKEVKLEALKKFRQMIIENPDIYDQFMSFYAQYSTIGHPVWGRLFKRLNAYSHDIKIRFLDVEVSSLEKELEHVRD